jgi:hypothetical protein
MRIKDPTWEIPCAAPPREDFLSISTDKNAKILYIIYKRKVMPQGARMISQDDKRRFEGSPFVGRAS